MGDETEGEGPDEGGVPATGEARPDADAPWLPREGEGAEAYAAAQSYFELGDGRSIAEVARRCGKNPSLIGRWSHCWGWVGRARAYDAHMAAVAHAARERALAAQVEKSERRRAELREREWNAGEALMRFAEAVLADAGKYRHDEVSPGEAALLFKRGSELARRATDLAHRPAGRGPGGGRPGT